MMNFEKIEKILNEDLLGYGSKILNLDKLYYTLKPTDLEVIEDYIKHLSEEDKMKILFENDGKFLNKVDGIDSLKLIYFFLPETHEEYKNFYFKLNDASKRNLNNRIFNDYYYRYVNNYLINIIFNKKIFKRPGTTGEVNRCRFKNICAILRGNFLLIKNIKDFDFVEILEENELVKDIFSHIYHDKLYEINNTVILEKNSLNNKNVIKAFKYYNTEIDPDGDFIFTIFNAWGSNNNRITVYNKINDIFKDSLKISTKNKEKIEKTIMNMTL